MLEKKAKFMLTLERVSFLNKRLGQEGMNGGGQILKVAT